MKYKGDNSINLTLILNVMSFRGELLPLNTLGDSTEKVKNI